MCVARGNGRWADNANNIVIITVRITTTAARTRGVMATYVHIYYMYARNAGNLYIGKCT